MGKAKLTKVINVIVLITVTGMPGLQKIMPLLEIKNLFDVKNLAGYVNDTFTIQILSFFGSLNWCTFLLYEIPKFDSIGKKSRFFDGILKYAVLSCAFLAIIIYGLYCLDVIVNLTGSIVILFGTTYFQLWRHFLLADQQRNILFIGDVTWILLTCMLLYFCKNIEATYILQALVSIAIPFIFYLFKAGPILYFNTEILVNSRLYMKKSLNYAMINVTTGSIPLLIAPISFQLLDNSYVAYIGMVNNISSIAILFPRATSFFYVPKLSLLFKENIIKFNEKFNEYFVRNISTIVIVFLFSVGVVSLYSEFYNNIYSNVEGGFVILLITFASFMLSQINLPHSNALLLYSKEYMLLKVNLYSSALYFLSITVIIIFSSKDYKIIYYYYVLLILMNMLKFIFLSKQVTKMQNI